MKQITTLTSSPKQKMQLVLDNNETADFYIYYNGRVQSWFFDISYNETIINCVKVCLHPNILRQFRRIIPFGLAFLSESKVEPFELTSFSSGQTGFYVLNSEEVETVEELITSYLPPETGKYIADFADIEEMESYTGVLNKGDYAFILDDGAYNKYSWNGISWVRA